MCGIVGYVGDNSASPILIDGLKKLEYRGYDSAGIAVCRNGKITTVKTKGRISDLQQKLDEVGTPQGSVGIGHTRWATHGAPTDANAHPHSGSSGRVTLVHNGIIENYLELKTELEKQGRQFKSQTDTEVLAQLFDSLYDGNPLETMLKVIKCVRGSYAVAVLMSDHPDEILAAKKDSPLIVGIGSGENYLASDIPALLKYTRDCAVMQDGEIAIVGKTSVGFFDSDGKPIDKKLMHITWDADSAEKGGYKHFMKKEIAEQPKAVRDTLGGRIVDGKVNLPELTLSDEQIKSIGVIHIVACGSAWHVGMTAKYLIERSAGILCECDLASEFRYRHPVVRDNDLCVVISQSGETADTLAALREAKYAWAGQLRAEGRRDEAVKLMEERHENYKIEHMADLADETEFSFFQQGEYVDMCIGPHLTYTKALKAFKITQQSGAYWKNDKENKMLTRINGVAFHNQEELDAWEKQQQEARERDHRKIGKEMRLFMTDDLVGRGLPMFLPNGYTVWQQLEDYIKGKERERGYLHVMTPCIGTVNLYKTSGHWDHYRENMFPAMEMEGESYVLRPMNCPHHMMIYANRPHSYRDLPMRIGEIAHDFRYESSGTLKGIERGRHFCQNDAHLFCTPEQIKSEVANVCSLIFDVYKDFNITDYRCVLSLRDPADKKKYHDDDAMWNHAENALREVLTELGINFTEEIGEAAFYGPKLDVNVKPAVGAEYTLSTCQLDFCLPAKFHLTYIDKDGSEKTPVVLHRAILGSLDRFMAYLIEETKGRFPTWLAPTQVKVLPVSEKTLDYARTVADKLTAAGVRVVLDESNEKIGYKIREAQQVDRVPYMLVLGAKEAEAGNISVRDRKGETTTQELDAFINNIVTEIKERRYN